MWLCVLERLGETTAIEVLAIPTAKATMDCSVRSRLTASTASSGEMAFKEVSNQRLTATLLMETPTRSREVNERTFLLIQINLDNQLE